MAAFIDNNLKKYIKMYLYNFPRDHIDISQEIFLQKFNCKITQSWFYRIVEVQNFYQRPIYNKFIFKSKLTSFDIDSLIVKFEHERHIFRNKILFNEPQYSLNIKFSFLCICTDSNLIVSKTVSYRWIMVCTFFFQKPIYKLERIYSDLNVIYFQNV